MAYALVMVEGDTEQYFYSKVKAKYKNNARAKIINLEGNYNINNKILNQIYHHHEAHPREEFSVLICIDNESRNDSAPIDLDYIKNEVEQFPNFSSDRIFLYLAVQDIESWFFYCIDEIYTFLQTPRNRRTRSYRPVEAYNNTHLSILFKENSKKYQKGRRLDHFLNQLDIDKIYSDSTKFNEFCEKLKTF